MTVGIATWETTLAARVLSGELSMVAALQEAANHYAPKPEGKVQIVIAPRGWVFVGFCRKEENDLVIERSHVIRRWGTKKGLGELISGPTKETILDPTGTTRIPLSAVLAKIDCEEYAWNTKI